MQFVDAALVVAVDVLLAPSTIPNGTHRLATAAVLSRYCQDSVLQSTLVAMLHNVMCYVNRDHMEEYWKAAEYGVP